MQSFERARVPRHEFSSHSRSMQVLNCEGVNLQLDLQENVAGVKVYRRGRTNWKFNEKGGKVPGWLLTGVNKIAQHCGSRNDKIVVPCVCVRCNLS